MDSPLLQAIILGIIQGLTEFLPVSSSGHLALAQQIMPGFKQPGLLLDVMLHVGTLVAVLAYFRKDLKDLVINAPGLLVAGDQHDLQRRRLIIGILIASVPTAIIGLMLEDRVEFLFGSTAGVGIALLVTGVVLIGGDLIGARIAPEESDVVDSGPPGPLSSFGIGIAQGLAVIPGISRSGATISVAKSFGITGEEAARFSFLASLPAVGWAAILTVLKNLDEIAGFSANEAVAYLAGPAVAALVGYIAIEVVMRTVSSGKFKWFALYCFIIGGAAVLVGYLDGLKI